MLHLYPLLGLFLILFIPFARAETPVTYTDIFVPPTCDIAPTTQTDQVNRYGAPLINDFDAQRKHVENGNALALPSANLDEDQVRILYMAEKTARTQETGCIDSNFFADAIALAQLDYIPAGFRIIEGTVYSVHTSREWSYINFENDWKTDTTIRFDHRKKTIQNL